MFLDALLDRLERVLDHGLEGNLVLTGTLSKVQLWYSVKQTSVFCVDSQLAQWPDPIIHMCLFDEEPVLASSPPIPLKVGSFDRMSSSIIVCRDNVLCSSASFAVVASCASRG